MQVDPHILRIVQDVISDYPNVEIVCLPPQTEVFAKTMYYICNDSYVADHSFMPSISHVRVSNSTVEYLLSYYQNHCHPVTTGKSRRLFLGRIGGRSIKNYNEILSIFLKFGFEEVFPHLLSFDEKLQLFANVEFLSGPLSSAFANAYFAPNLKEVLVLTNCSRYLDPYLANLSNKNNFRLIHYLGRQLDLNNEDSSFEIDATTLYNHLFQLFGAPVK